MSWRKLRLRGILSFWCLPLLPSQVKNSSHVCVKIHFWISTIMQRDNLAPNQGQCQWWFASEFFCTRFEQIFLDPMHKVPVINSFLTCEKPVRFLFLCFSSRSLFKALQQMLYLPQIASIPPSLRAETPKHNVVRYFQVKTLRRWHKSTPPPPHVNSTLNLDRSFQLMGFFHKNLKCYLQVTLDSGAGCTS